MPDILHASIAGLTEPGLDKPMQVPENLDTTFDIDQDGNLSKSNLMASQVFSQNTAKQLRNFPHIMEQDCKTDFAAQAGGDNPDHLPNAGI